MIFPMDGNLLYYGDNLEILRDHVKDESVDPEVPQPRAAAKRRPVPLSQDRRAADRRQSDPVLLHGGGLLCVPAASDGPRSGFRDEGLRGLQGCEDALDDQSQRDGMNG